MADSMSITSSVSVGVLRTEWAGDVDDGPAGKRSSRISLSGPLHLRRARSAYSTPTVLSHAESPLEGNRVRIWAEAREEAEEHGRGRTRRVGSILTGSGETPLTAQDGEQTGDDIQRIQSILGCDNWFICSMSVWTGRCLFLWR